MTVTEFKKKLESEGKHQAIEDIFYTNLRLPSGVRVPRDPAQIQRWLDDVWPKEG